MSGTNATKTASLIYAVVLIILFCLPISIDDVGLKDGELYRRITYQHFHASLFHLLTNLWVMLSYVFIAKVSWKKLVLAFIISATYPFVGDTLIVGISGMLYAIVGFYALAMPTLNGRIRYNTIVVATILLGLLFPNIGVGIHIYCYLIGCLIAILNYPIIKTKDK